ncbi:MAG: hypothetical protein QNJ40_23395 [Xanthomonadales bacterium]|nr:hypothetical protein [Xanthomonadales bacterium]
MDIEITLRNVSAEEFPTLSTAFNGHTHDHAYELEKSDAFKKVITRDHRPAASRFWTIRERDAGCPKDKLGVKKDLEIRDHGPGKLICSGNDLPGAWKDLELELNNDVAVGEIKVGKKSYEVELSLCLFCSYHELDDAGHRHPDDDHSGTWHAPD